MTLNGEPVTFTYDASGKPETMTYLGETYYYVTNLQGDVVHIVDSSGTWLVHYYYTAYGSASASQNADHAALSATLISANPLTYRGYVYDQGTSLYYLQSRYYNPNTGRFINADALVSTGQGLLGNNMFAYCLNNPVNGADPTGELTKGQIHNEVLVRICFWTGGQLVMTHTTIYYNKIDHTGGWGFCDLYNPKTGEVWELKRLSRAASCQKPTAQIQLGKYVSGRLKEHIEVPLTEGKTYIAPGAFTHYDAATELTYLVWYFDGGDGIIFYDYIVYKEKMPNYAVTYVELPSKNYAWLFGLLPVGPGRTSPLLEEKFESVGFAA